MPHVWNQEPKAPRRWQQKEDKNITMQTVSLLTISCFFHFDVVFSSTRTHCSTVSVDVLGGTVMSFYFATKWLFTFRSSVAFFCSEAAITEGLRTPRHPSCLFQYEEQKSLSKRGLECRIPTRLNATTEVRESSDNFPRMSGRRRCVALLFQLKMSELDSLNVHREVMASDLFLSLWK